MTQNAERIDSKYEVLSEVSRDGHLVLYNVLPPTAPQNGRPQAAAVAEVGQPLRLGWFEVSSSAQRSSFHRYRAALKALAPAGLVDVVARPGAYYTVWRPLEGQPLGAFLALPRRDEAAVQGLRDLATALSEQGFALPDAEVVFPEDGEPQLAYLAPAERPLEEAAALNAQTLAPLKTGRLRRRRPALSVWAVLPGLLFLGGAGYLGAQAARIYLNPPVHEVIGVLGQPAEQAAAALAQRGFRVVYTDGEAPGQDVGTVVAQDPPPASTLPAGRQVTLTVNNPPPLTVPRLDDLSLNQVAVALAENRLRQGQVLTVDGTLTGTPKGRVIAQLPAAGSTAQRGDKVALLVSGGVSSKQTWLPPLTGLSFEDARDLVRRAGLVIIKVTRQSSSARVNTVLGQSPAPYAKVDVGSPVTLALASVPVSGPSQSAGALPLPPPPVPVTPPTPDTGTQNPGTQVPDTSGTQTPATGTPATQTPATQTPTTQTPTTQTPATQTPATQTPDTQTPTTQTPATPTPATQTPATQPRTVRLNYTFPASLPDGTVDIVVRDADGERTVLGSTPTASAAGATAQQDGISVRGDAVFIVRLDGKDLTTFPAR